MKIFELSTDANNFQNVVAKNKSDWEIISNANLKSLATNWEPIELKFIGKGKRGDCPSFVPFMPVFSERAINILNDLMKDSAEYLPFLCPGKVKFWGINVLRTIDCIDFTNSKVVRFSSGKIMEFKKYAFKVDILDDVDIFKIPDLRNSMVFVSENFVNKVNEAGLEGFEFKEVG